MMPSRKPPKPLRQWLGSGKIIVQTGGPAVVRVWSVLFRLLHPFLPMCWMDLDRPPQFNVHPRIATATAGKNEGMDRPATVNNCEPNMVPGNIRGAIELVPHAYC
jgi:hypothetical protein